MKVRKNLLPTGTNNENLANDRIFFPKSGKFGPFLSWKILSMG
jgi:hypothetical protein